MLQLRHIYLIAIPALQIAAILAIKIGISEQFLIVLLLHLIFF